MYALTRFWQSTIGKKVVMAVTGIVGILFVIGHMSGNLLMFKGQDAMHHYALLLRTSMPLLYVVRATLFACVALHVVSAYQLTMIARAARPENYVERRPQVTTFAAKTMRWGGVLLLVFIVFHLLQLTLGVVHPRFTHLDPYNNVAIALSNPLMVAFYVLAMAALALHVHHGIWAALRTIGASRSSAEPLKRALSVIIAVIIAAGFMIIPLATLAGVFPEQPPVVDPASASATNAQLAPVAVSPAGEAR